VFANTAGTLFHTSAPSTGSGGFPEPVSILGSADTSAPLFLVRANRVLNLFWKNRAGRVIHRVTGETTGTWAEDEAAIGGSDAVPIAVAVAPVGAGDRSILLVTREEPPGGPFSLRVHGLRGAVWETVVGGQFVNSTAFASIAVDGEGWIHLAYSGLGNFIQYARFVPMIGAQLESVSPIMIGTRVRNGTADPGLAMALDGTTAVVAFQNPDSPAQLVRIVNGTTPSVGSVDDIMTPFVSQSSVPRLVIDSTGAEHLLLSTGVSRDDHEVRYVRKDIVCGELDEP
jgi:hypothetical protein